MSDESDREIINHAGRKGKRGTARIEDSGSESDSSFEHRKKRKKVLRVASDPESSSDESDGPLVKSASRRRVPRVMSDGGETGDDFEIFTSEGDDDDTGEEEEEGDENGSEEYSSSGSGSEETGSSSCSDWESEEEEGDERLEERGASSLQSSVTSKAEKQDKEVHDGAALASSSMAAAYMSDSSDGQSEKCPICLLSFNTQEVGTPESCDHSFCVECIQEWAKNVNTCPVDRQVFTLILVRRSLEGKVIRKIPIEPPRRQDEDEAQEDATYCEVCGECDREDRMLLCDGCDLGYHLECLDPPMDTVPLEEWFCPDCILSNSVHLAEEVDIQDGELTALLEDAHAVGLPPLRPRVSRLLPRTRQSERVRATMITRQRQRAGNEQRDRAQPSTSSGIDSLEADSNASVSSTRRRAQTQTAKTTRKRRKTTRRKKTRTRKKRRKTSTRKTKPKTTTSSTKSGLSEVSKKRHKKRRKVKRRKRKTTSRRVRRPARVKLPVPHTVRSRLAEHLGVCPPRRPGQTIPDVRPRVTSTRIDFQRSRAGIPTLHLFGQRDQLDYFSSGSDHEGDIGSGGDLGGNVSVMAHPRVSATRPGRFPIIKKRMLSSVRSRREKLCPAFEERPSEQAAPDVIGSILNSQSMWHSKKSVVTINRDGSLNIKSDGKETPRRNTEKSGSSDSGFNSTDSGVTVRTDDRLSQISNSDTPVNISEAGSSTCGHVTQAPMYPGRGGAGGTRPPGGGGFQQFGGNRYGSSPSYHSFQIGRGGYSNFPPPSSFDSRGARAGYANYLNSGPPPPFRGSPLRFRMAPRFPNRRPLLPPPRPPQLLQIQQIPPSSVEEFHPEDDVLENQKPPSVRPEEEEDEIDIYSDIEVGGSGSGGPGGCGSEPDDGDRGMELAYEALPPPPIPPALLMGMGGDTPSDEEPCSDSELVIDDNIAPSSPPDESDKYDPEEALGKPEVPEIPESEKYDPAEPSYDTDEEEEAAAKAQEALCIIPPPPDISTAMSTSHVVAHSSSNSSASYLHSPTYGDNSVLGLDVKVPATVCADNEADDDDDDEVDGDDSRSSQEVLKDVASTVKREPCGLSSEPVKRQSLVVDYDDDEDEEDECPNFSIYSAASMDIARRTGDDDDDDNIPLPKTITDEKGDSDSEKENKSILTEEKDENSNLSASEEMASQKDESEKEQPSVDLEEKEPKSSIEPEEGELSEKHQENTDVDEEDICESAEVNKVAEGDEAPESETADGVKKLTLVEEIFGSDDNDSLIGGATSAVSAATVDNAPQTSVTPLGLEGLDTETISETEEAINFEDELSQEDGFLTAEEDGEIPSVKRKKKKKTRKTSAAGSVGEEAAAVKDHTPQEVVDYEEGEIVDDRPKQHESTKKDKKVSEKKDKSKYEKEMQKTTDENFDITSKSKTAPEEERKKKKKKSSSDKTRVSKDRAVLSSSENKDKGKDKPSKTEDANIAWKKLSKSSKERNYRDPKTKPDGDSSKVKDISKKKDAATKESVAKKDKKKKEKRKDMERYDVRKIVTDKKRKRRDAFGRDLSRDRSYTKSRSRSRGRSYDRSRGRSSRSLSRTRITRSKGRSPVKARVRSRSRSRIRSRSRSRNRSRSRSKTRSKVKSKDRLRRSRSKEKQRPRVSRSRSRGRRSRSRTRSRSRNRSRVRSRSRSPVRSRDRRERSRERRDSARCRYRERRSWSHSWTPSWSRSRSVSCSSYSCSRTPTPRRFDRSYSRSFSRSWSRERHERIPVIEKKSGAISKTAKKLTVIVSNTKDDSERRRKKEKKRKEAKKNKEALAALEKRKKRKEKSPAPSKEVFTSGDNILVSVNFKSNKSAGNKEVLSSSAALTVANKEAVKRKQHDGSFELEREAPKKLRKDKSTKEKTSPCQKNGGMVAEKTVVRSGEKKLKKAAQRVSNKASRVQTIVNKKPVAIIDLDQSPFHEQTPSPTDLIVLTDSDEEGLNKENGREELSESLNSRRTMRPTSSSPKLSSMNSAPSNAIAHTPESQSPPMNAVGSYLVTSTGPKTPPEPQIKFSITTKPQLRPLSNPLREDEDMMADDAGLDDLDQRIEEELDRGLDRGLGDIIHKGPNTPPEPRGPTTPRSPPTSPDAYDPFDPTKSGTPSPVGAGASMDGPPSPAHTPPEQLIQLNVISRESPMVSDLEELANKSLEPRVITPTMASQEEVVDQSSQSPDRSKISVRGDATIASSPSIVPETTSLPPPVTSDNELSQPSELPEGSEKSKQMSVSLPPPGPASIIADSNATKSPERIIPVVISAIPQNLQGTPVKSQLFPTTTNKQVPPQQPMTSTPAHSSAPAPVFPTLTPTNIASILCTAPASTLPLNRIGLFNPPTISVPQLMVHHHPQQQQNQQQQLISSPIIQQRPPPSIVRTTPEKLAIPSTKLPPVRAAVQNGEQTQISQKPPQDTMTDVVDMDLESPYSPGSSEGDDLFDPPAEIKSSGTSASFTALTERNRTVPQPAKNITKLPLPLAAMLHKSPSKPANQDKFDSIFGLSPLRVNKTAPARVTRASTKAHHAKGNKGKGKSKGGKKEIAIKMDEDQLQILDDLPSSAVELQFLKKLNRQERVVEEVKLSLKPHYTKKHITKEEYKDILRRSVPKICHNRSGEINPIKISCLVEAYVKKYRYHAKKKNPVGPKTKVNKTTMWS